MPVFGFAAVVVMIASAAADAPAEPTTVAERIARAMSAFNSLEYEAAALELTLAAADARATELERIEANLWAGVAERVLGHDTDARLHFLYVLHRAPATRLPADVGPKILSFFELVREEVAGDARASSEASPEPARAPDDPPAVAAMALAPVLLGSGALVAVVGGGVLMLGAQPWVAHAAAREELARASASGVEAAGAADAQAAARADWESWGAVLAVGGGVGAAIGVLAAAIGGSWWAMEGT